jgi:hypothetical protein
MSAKKDNYKAKWLAALAAHVQTPTQEAENLEKRIEVIDSTQFNAHRELEALHDVLIECAQQARGGCELLDHTRDVGTLMFKEAIHDIDGRISKMPSRVIARRVRDVLKLLEERVGIQFAIIDNQRTAIGSMTQKLSELEISNRKLQRSVLTGLILGQNPTANEMEDYIANPSSVRRNSEYTELSDDNIGLLIPSRSPSQTNIANNAISDTDDIDAQLFGDDSDIEQAKAVVSPKSRAKRANGNTSYVPV